MTLPTTCWQTTANTNANADAKKCHCQEDNQQDNATDSVDAGNGIRANNSNKAIDKAVNVIRSINASKAAKAINIITEVKAIKNVNNAKGDINCYTTALIHSLNVHHDAMDTTIKAEKTKKGHAAVRTDCWSILGPF